jgi:DNA-binding PadR family transcriptional regulator
MRDNIMGGALTETTFLVLLSTYSPNHGYGIMQFIERETGGRVLLGAGTLYGAINTLLRKKWIVPVGIEAGVSKKEYVITDIGKQVAEKELSRIANIWHLAAKIMGGASK